MREHNAHEKKLGQDNASTNTHKIMWLQKNPIVKLEIFLCQKGDLWTAMMKKNDEMQTSYNNDDEDKYKWGFQNKTTSLRWCYPRKWKDVHLELSQNPRNLNINCNGQFFKLLSTKCKFWQSI